MTSTTCRLCGSTNASRLFVKVGVGYFRCRDCGMIFCWPDGNPNLSRKSDDFEAAYMQYLQPNASDRFNHVASLRWISRRADLHAAKVIDIGCGSGKWVKFLRSRGVNAIGIEPSIALYERFLMGQAFFRNVMAGDICAKEAGQYDIVTALDVLEHVPSPRSFLESAKKLLRPGGKIFLSTPDVGSLLPAVLGRRWHHFNDCHLSYFSPDMLARLLKELGFNVKAIEHRGKMFPAGYMLRYFAEFILGKKAGDKTGPLDRVAIPLNTFDIMYCCACV